MDRVSALLEARERRLPKRAPYVVAAVALHLGVVFGVFAAAQLGPRTPDLLPSVAVRLVAAPSPEPLPSQPSGPATPEPTRPESEPAPEPEPPQPAPEPEPEAVPEPATTEPETPADSEPRPQQPSADAMPDASRPAATPAPTPRPQPSGGGRHSGLSLGGDGSATSGPAIPSDFHFTYYVERMLALIESRWYKPPVPAGTRALIQFRIARDGRLSDIVLEQSSGVPTFDRAALRAMYAANPLPPLPPAYRKPSLKVHLAFSE
jgi:TonB family protein